MKAVSSFVLLVVIALAQARAQFVVLDVANLAQSITNYAALIEQLSGKTYEAFIRELTTGPNLIDALSLEPGMAAR